LDTPTRRLPRIAQAAIVIAIGTLGGAKLPEIEHFDEIILGGGKGGKSLALALAPAGHRVALVERKFIGGSCINVACIPTKTMVASAKLVDQAKHAGDFGVALSPAGPSLKSIIERKRRVVAGMVDTHKNLFANTPNLTFIAGEGAFTSANEIAVNLADGSTRHLSGDRIFINTGSRTAIPQVKGLSEIPYLTSTSIMELEELPEHLVIVGGGYIALEFSQIFRRLGSKVTVLLRGDRFLPREDEDIAALVKQVLEEDGIEFRANAKIDSVANKTPQSISISLGDGQGDLLCSHLLLAIGRTSNTENIGLEKVGIEIDAHANIKVNEYLETNVPNVWALGDCNGGPLFTHVSWDDYRIARDRILHDIKRSTTNRLVPYTLFIDPELGRVGLTETEARKRGLDILVAKLPANKIPRAMTSGEPKGLLKAVVDRNSKQILGCSLFCHSAGEVMSVVQMAMLGKLTYADVRDTVFTHPTMAESLNLLFATI